MAAASQPTQIFSRKQLTSQQTPAYVAEAEAQLERREFAEARQTLEQGLAAHGPSVAALLGLAGAFWDDPDTTARDPKRSIDSLKEAIQLAPKDARPYALLGRYLLSKGLRDQALNFLDRAIQLDPQDGTSRRLRERASLQKQKQYTVVANAKDLLGPAGIQANDAKASSLSPAAQAKKEVTRFLQFDPARAADAMEQVEQAEASASIDDAIGALVGAGLVKADTSLLKAQRTRRATGMVGRILGIVMLAAVGATFGVAYQRVFPARTTNLDANDAVLDSGSVAAIGRFLERADAERDPEHQVMSALGHALLVADHGADDSHVESVEQRLRSLPAEHRRDSRALLARALIVAHPIADPDPSLGDELEQALRMPPRDGTSSQWLALALAAQRWSSNDPAGVVDVLSPWALGADTLGRVDLELARAFAAQDEDTLALEVLARLTTRLPRYLPAHTLAVALDFRLLTRDAPLRTDRGNADSDASEL
ncbi:MAG: tetratricopeptide repeat protein, partial [Myxococcota bacterium]